MSSEYLDYIRLQETEFEYEISIQLDGGGAALSIKKDSDSKTVAGELRYFAELIEQSVLERKRKGL